MDELAARGRVYDRAYTPNPVCSPERASLQTGLWATQHGCVTIPGTEVFRSADPQLPTLTALLAQGGYRVRHVGKFHSEVVGSPLDHGAESYISSHGYRRWREAAGLPKIPNDQGLFGQSDPGITAEQSSLWWQTDQVLSDLEALGEGPWFLRWDPPEPHLPNVVPPPYDTLVPLDSIRPWLSFRGETVPASDAQYRTRERWGTLQWSWRKWRPVVQRYLGEIALLDTCIGRIVDALAGRKLLKHTIIVITTDHGDMAGGHGMMDKHYVMYEDIVRVPLLIVHPEWAASADDRWVIHALDLPKTFLKWADLPAPSGWVGEDLNLPPIRSGAMSQYQGTHQGLFSMRMWRNERWKYVYAPAGKDELYDLINDPGEHRNLIDDATVCEIVGALKTAPTNEMKRIQDPLSPPDFRWSDVRWR